MQLRRVALGALVAGAVLLPATAASASHSAAKVRLSVVPLQKAQLGAAGKSLALDYDSGTISNWEAMWSQLQVFNFRGAPPTSFAKLGRITGYALDYGDPFTASTGVMEIRSSVDEYKTPAAALKGLAACQYVESGWGEPSSPVLPITEKEHIKVAPVGQRRFGDLITAAAPNLNPIVWLDEQVAVGRFVLDLSVTAGSASAAEAVAPHLLRVLHGRLQSMLGGHAVGKPATLPPAPQAGQAPGGPDLSTMILQASDIGQQNVGGQVQGYDAEPPALSTYFNSFQPADSYDWVSQWINWWPTATEATYAETYGNALGAATASDSTPVDLSAVGDNARGYSEPTGDTGQGTLFAFTLTNGRIGEFVFGVSESTLQASDIQSLARAAANRLDAGLGP